MNFKVLIIDDDEVCLLIHKQIISVSGFHDGPLTFPSAELACEYLNGLPAEDVPVLIFLDINMPGMNGWELLDIIHAGTFKANIHVVVVSSSIDDRDKNKAYSYSKVIEFIEKPFTISEIEKLKGRTETISMIEKKEV